jgi:ADP-heptose:LPS heptosyltransferase
MLPPFFFSVRLPTLLAMLWRRFVRRHRTGDGSHREPPSYILFRLDGLGDVVLTTPLFRALRSAHPNARLTVVVQPTVKALLATNPYIDEILTLPGIKAQWWPVGLRRLAAAIVFYRKELQGRHFQFAISPRWDVDEHLATFLCVLVNASHRLGYSCETSAAKRLINRGFDRAYDICLPPGPVRHEVLRNLAIAERLGATSCDDSLDIRIGERDRRRSAKLLANVPPATTLIAIGIGALSVGRRWPLVRFAQTVNRIGEARQVQPVIVCSSAELGEALKLADLLHSAPVIVSGAALREVCAVLERCELFIGNDSGSAHLAAAAECSTIVISRHPRNGDPNHFNSPVRFAPYASGVRVLQPAAGRDQCRDACVVLERHCILDVTVDDVTAAAVHMLDSQDSSVARRLTPREVLVPSLLFQVHSVEAVRRAVEALCPGTNRPAL